MKKGLIPGLSSSKCLKDSGSGEYWDLLACGREAVSLLGAKDCQALCQTNGTSDRDLRFAVIKNSRHHEPAKAFVKLCPQKRRKEDLI